ncbi:class III extradiol dioxygenase family protein [Rhodopila sp.]|uniref:class III extradiol dioxygenase family protein n=1 Tax=Rhodopila sp. TaxID=2480087 RepID=UPI003D13A32A
MATVIGGIGTSHAPTIGVAWDKGQQREPMWAPLFDGYVPARRWLDEVKPDLFLIVYNDHVNQFFFDAYPTFALGVGAVHAQADEGWGKRALADLPGDPDFAWHLARSLVEDEFDPTICQEMALDHGILSFLPLLTDTDWKVPVVPLAVNVIQHPIPTARRLFRLGAALRRAIESYPGGRRIVVVGTGGLTHQLHGAAYGRHNEAWDHEFMDRLESDPAGLSALSIQEYMERGGTEGVEMIMWLAMRGALGDRVRRVHRNYTAPLTTGYGLLVLES